MAGGIISSVLEKSGGELQAAWARDLATALPSGKGRISVNELEQQTGEFLKLLTTAAAHSKGADISAGDFKPLREFLEGVSRSRALQGFTSDETATFIFSFKKPLFERLRVAAGKDVDTLAGRRVRCRAPAGNRADRIRTGTGPRRRARRRLPGAPRQAGEGAITDRRRG